MYVQVCVSHRFLQVRFSPYYPTRASKCQHGIVTALSQFPGIYVV